MEYLAHLSKDKKFSRILAGQEFKKLARRKHIHIDLCGSIMSQQLSTKVAATIHKRFLALFDGKPDPKQILEISYERLKGIGLSHAKTTYVQNVACFAVEHGLQYSKLSKMGDEEVIAYLTQIKGVGRWTAEMMLMFSLGREDVFALDDLGIKNAMIRLYKLKTENSKNLRQEMLRIAEKWRPYRTYACIHLWNWQDNKPLR